MSAYVANSSLQPVELPALIVRVHAALNILGSKYTAAEAETATMPATAQVRKSITPDALISFIDGKYYKTLKRHLSTHGLDPYSYRQRYRLPNDYPMVAASYAAQRSGLAKSVGLGRQGGRAASEETAQAPKGRGRRKAA
ncbi:putative transcriptional regulator [Methylobacterium sp. BE186]|nr:putative transcriptional regulator [Methylobacterium sp. BE186]